MRVLGDDEILALARASGIEVRPEELHEVALRLSVLLDAIDRVPENGIDDVDPDSLGDGTAP